MSETLTGKVLNFRLALETAGPTFDAPRLIKKEEGGGEPSKENTTVAQLYPLAKEINPQLHVAVEYIDEALGLITEAREHLLENNRLSADDCGLRLRALLPELFACDTLSDGFRSVVLALIHSLINLEGALVEQDQFIRMKEALEIIRKQPFLQFDDAIEVHSLLENAGLCPDPKSADEIADLITDDIENEEPSSDVVAG